MTLRDELTREQLIAASHIKNMFGLKSITVITRQQHERLMAIQAKHITDTHNPQ
jgi:hypothetical protein